MNKKQTTDFERMDMAPNQKVAEGLQKWRDGTARRRGRAQVRGPTAQMAPPLG